MQDELASRQMIAVDWAAEVELGLELPEKGERG
jgi:hypothetical protein